MEVRPWSQKKGQGSVCKSFLSKVMRKVFGSKSEPTPRPRTLLCSRDLAFGVYGGTIPTRMSIPWILVPVAAVTTTAKNIKPAPAPLRESQASDQPAHRETGGDKHVSRDTARLETARTRHLQHESQHRGYPLEGDVAVREGRAVVHRS